MSLDAEKLYEMLPAIYRVRDSEQGEPLKALLCVIAEQVVAFEENLAQLYDDQFIETCAEWVVPYIGDLIGYQKLYNPTSQLQTSRAEVANTIRLRRRKGTAAMVRELVEDASGWNAHVVEFFQKLATTQYMNHIRPDNLATPDLRRWEDLEHLGGPFDTLSRTVDIRSIGRGRGLYNLANIGIYLWRLRLFSLTASPAFGLDDQRYFFDPLGLSKPLFSRPLAGDQDSGTGRPADAPRAITRRALDERMQDFYGVGASLFIDGVAPGQIIAADLSDGPGGSWAHQAPAGKIAVDPVLGRIAFGTAPAAAPKVTYHYMFSDALGGGEYDRQDALELAPQPAVAIPAQNRTIQQALGSVAGGGAVEVGDSGCYKESLTVMLAAAGVHVELRAANRTRPLLVLGDVFQVSGPDDSELTLSGLTISGGAIRIVETADGKGLGRLILSHCTLVPGIALGTDGTPEQSEAPSLLVETAGTIVQIDHCILGGIRAVEGAEIEIADSIVDAISPSGVAYAGMDGKAGGASLRMENCTVIGKVHTVRMTLVSNSILQATLLPGDDWPAAVIADRRQQGCVRFSYVPTQSRTSRRFRCLPNDDSSQDLRPAFSSLRYGEPAYCQLSQRCPPEIRSGADDGAEMGAFHGLFQPQRETNLRVRLEEYLRFGLEAGIIHAN